MGKVDELDAALHPDANIEIQDKNQTELQHSPVPDMEPQQKRRKDVAECTADQTDVEMHKHSDVDAPHSDDRLSLLTGDWLTDRLIDSVNTIVNQHIGVSQCQSVTVSQTSTGFVPVDDETIMILYDKDRSHRITTACIDGQVMYLDSLHGSLSRDVKKQMRQLYAKVKSNDHEIVVRVVSCQRQHNSSDCGVYAAAFAFELAVNGYDGINLVAAYDTRAMRAHLLTCLTNGQVQTFPKLSATKRTRRAYFSCVSI